MNRRRRVCMSVPSTNSPALKSIQWGLSWNNVLLVDIFIVGTNVPKGVPRPVVKSTSWQPAEANAVDATRSLPGAESRLSPPVCRRSPYSSTPLTGARPHFWVHPSALSSSVEMPPALLPGEGFSPTGSPCERKYSLKSLTILTVRLNNSGVLQRFIRMVSAPNISGTSVNIEVPPCATSQSLNSPTRGLAVMPENPSLPPHFNPTRSLPMGTSVRRSWLAKAYNWRSSRMPSSISSPSTFWVTSNLMRSWS